MSNKLLTLAVPTYNMEKYLARCLDSVLCDNRDYLEVIVVNDGSKDSSSEIGHEYEAKYPDVIRVIDKENGNYGSCVNRALAEATGKYFRMLDADDWCDTHALNQWIEYLKSCDADMVLTVAEDRDEQRIVLNKLEAPPSVLNGRVYSIDDFDGIKLEYKDLFCSHIITYKTAILREIKLQLQTGISYTDNEYVFFPLDHVQSVIYYNLPVYQYFVGREGQTTQPDVLAKQSNQICQVFHRLFSYYNLHKTEQKESVLNNQRILLVEMLSWIYKPLFWDPVSTDKLRLLRQMESIVIADAVVYGMIADQSVMLKFYRRTGLYLDSFVARAYRLMVSLIICLKRSYYAVVRR